MSKIMENPAIRIIDIEDAQSMVAAALEKLRVKRTKKSGSDDWIVVQALMVADSHLRRSKECYQQMLGAHAGRLDRCEEVASC